MKLLASDAKLMTCDFISFITQYQIGDALQPLKEWRSCVTAGKVDDVRAMLASSGFDVNVNMACVRHSLV